MVLYVVCASVYVLWTWHDEMRPVFKVDEPHSGVDKWCVERRRRKSLV